MWISGPPRSCRHPRCTSTASPVVTHELWDARDEVVVGAAVCERCRARHLFSRRPIAQERALPQAHGQPMQRYACLLPTTAVIADRYKAGESIDDLAKDYGEERLNIEE